MLVSPIHIRTLAETLDLLGISSAALAAQCGVPEPLRVDDNSPWVPLEAFDQMMRGAMVITGDEGFGLIAGTSLALARYGTCASLVTHARTLRCALKDIQRYAVLLQPEVEFTVEEGDASVRLLIQPLSCSEDGHRFRSETLMLGLIQMLRYMGARDADIEPPGFAFPRPAYAQRYEAMMGPRVRFGQAVHCTLEFNRNLMDVIQPCRDHDVYAMFKARAEVALAGEKAKGGILREVRVLINQNLSANLTALDVASQLNISERGLRRQLAVAGLQFSSVLSDCQHRVAIRLLASGDHSIQQVASALGFSSASCFHRAFKRWTGLTPVDWCRWNQKTNAVAGSSHLAQHTA